MPTVDLCTLNNPAPQPCSITVVNYETGCTMYILSLAVTFDAKIKFNKTARGFHDEWN